MPGFVFRRAFPWLQQALDPAAPLLGPDVVISELIPTVDIFGTQRIAEQQATQALGGVGNLEVFHSAVPQNRVRLYSAVEASHDDPTDRWIRIGTIVAQIPSSFVFVGVTDAQLRPAATSPLQGEGAIAARSVWVGPGSRVSARVNAIVAGAQLALRVAWVEFSLGESVRFE
jgi:hypothetical protein